VFCSGFNAALTLRLGDETVGVAFQSLGEGVVSGDPIQKF